MLNIALDSKQQELELVSWEEVWESPKLICADEAQICGKGYSRLDSPGLVDKGQHCLTGYTAGQYRNSLTRSSRYDQPSEIIRGVCDAFDGVYERYRQGVERWTRY